MKKIFFATSEKKDGNMRSNDPKSKDNLQIFLETNGFKIKNPIFMGQIHSNEVKNISGKDVKSKIDNCDGLVLCSSDKSLAILTADCLPIILFDAENEIVAALHAGYKGITLGILNEAITQMVNSGASVKQIELYVGPAIGICCYNIDTTREEEFTSVFPHAHTALEKRSGKIYISLQRIIKNEAQLLGIPTQNITISPLCTKCHDLHFSFRQEVKLYGAQQVSGLNVTVVEFQ